MVKRSRAVSRSIVVAAVFAASVAAQGSIGDGNVTYAVTTLPTTTSSVNGLVDFAAAGVDQVFQCWWYYRLGGEAREHAFNAGSGQLAQNYSGSTATLTWPNVDGKGITATNVITVYSTGPRAGVASHRFTVTNTRATPVTITLFCYLDADFCGSSNSDTATPAPTTQRIRIRDGLSCTGDFLDFVARGSDRYEVVPYPSLRVRLLDNAFDDLADAGTPFGPADFSGAHQWRDRVLQPNESLTVYAALAMNVDICSEPAGSANYGTGFGGAGGPPTLTSGAPFLGTPRDVRLGNALPGAAPLLLLGQGRNVIGVPGVGTFHLVPLVTLPMPIVDAGGTSRTTIPIPGNLSLCGTGVHWQAVYVDPSAANAIATTPGLEWAFGGM